MLADVTDASECERVASETVERFGPARTGKQRETRDEVRE